jgi:hypothetical protein
MIVIEIATVIAIVDLNINTNTDIITNITINIITINNWSVGAIGGDCSPPL